jgi:phosphate-selective porin OprO/OprP
MLTALMACGTSAAMAQYGPAMPADSAYMMAGESGANNHFVSNLNADTDKDLSARVKDLESALKKMKDKEAADKKKASSAPTVKVRGRIHVDGAAFDQNDASIVQAGSGDRESYDSVYFRRARIGVSGDMFDVVDYKIEMDFAGQTAFKDVYITIKELPLLQNVRVGHFYEAFGLEAQTSSNYITFMERSLINEVGQIGGRKMGVMAFGWSESEYVTWSVSGNTTLSKENPPGFPFDGRTGNKDDFFGAPTYPVGGRYGLYDDNGGYAVSMRGTYLPWYDECSNGRGLLHTGFSYTYRDVPTLVPGQSQRYRITQRPEAARGNNVVNTGWMDDTDSINAFAPEVAFVYGPFSVQSEYIWMNLNRTTSANPNFDGGYIYVSYFLTGENRTYDRQRGVFSRVKPYENFFRVRTEDGCVETGKGAWEVGYRCSYLNLADAGVNGGRVVDHTFGVNWYLNPYTRLMANYIRSETTERAPGVGVMDIFMTRFQVDF